MPSTPRRPRGPRLYAILLAAATVLFVSVAQSEEGDVEYRAVTIWSQGVRLAGDLYRPGNISAEEPVPGILLVPGWGGSKENLKRHYAQQFAGAGFVVLAFDFKGWGQSDGPLLAAEKLATADESVDTLVEVRHVRKVVNPFSMSADVRAALHYLAGEPGVAGDKLGIWGTSMGGALALVSATSDDRIKAYVSQMSPVNYAYNLRQIPDALMRQAESQAARGEIPPYPGPGSRADSRLPGYPDWVALKLFSPLDKLDRLQAPTLIIDAEDETLFEPAKNGALMYESIRDRVPSRYVTYPGGHYEMYKGPNLESARKEALDWFVAHLK